MWYHEREQPWSICTSHILRRVVDAQCTLQQIQPQASWAIVLSLFSNTYAVSVVRKVLGQSLDCSLTSVTVNLSETIASERKLFIQRTIRWYLKELVMDANGARPMAFQDASIYNNSCKHYRCINYNYLNWPQINVLFLRLQSKMEYLQSYENGILSDMSYEVF